MHKANSSCDWPYRVFSAIACASVVGSAQAGVDHQHGRISDVTILADEVLIRLDSGTPTNCTGTPHGWMVVPAASKAMKALVLALWVRGDAAQTPVVVYTTPYSGNGYCAVTQLDPTG